MITKEKIIEYLEYGLLREVSNTQEESEWYFIEINSDEYLKDLNDFNTSLECLQDILERFQVPKESIKNVIEGIQAYKITDPDIMLELVKELILKAPVDEIDPNQIKANEIYCVKLQ